MTVKFTEDISGSKESATYMATTCQAYVQAIADAKNEDVEGTFKQPTGTFTYKASPKNNPTTSPVPQQPATGAGGDGVPINRDTTALKHKNVFHESGPSSDPDNKASTQSFNSAVSTAFNVIALATSLRTLIPQTSALRNTKTNYYLTDTEKALIAAKATEFASYGMVRFDVLEDFLYVLVAIDNYDDLQLVASVTNIPELDNSYLVRDPMGILSVRDLYKIGYMAHGLSSLTKQIDHSTYPQAQSSSDHTGSAFGALLSVAAFSSSPMGALSNVLGPAGAAYSMGLSGTAMLSQAASLSSAGSIPSFPGVDSVSITIAKMQVALLSLANIVAPFGTPTGYTNCQGQIDHCGDVISSLNEIKSYVDEANSTITTHKIYTLTPVQAHLSSFSKDLRNAIGFATQLASATSTNQSKTPDMLTQLGKIKIVVGTLNTTGSSIAAEIAAIQSPGNLSSAASALTRTGGMATSSVLAELTMGQRIPPSVICNNPMMQPPSFAGRAFFGEGLTPRISTDQMFSRRIATYPTSSAGSGVMSFQMQNFGSFGSSMSLTSLISRVMIGVAIPPVSGALASMIGGQASQIASLLGCAAAAMIDPRRSDHSIPFMIAASASMVQDTRSPFSTSVFSSGWKQAAGVGNDLQRYSPQYLRNIRTNL